MKELEFMNRNIIWNVHAEVSLQIPITQSLKALVKLLASGKHLSSFHIILCALVAVLYQLVGECLCATVTTSTLFKLFQV